LIHHRRGVGGHGVLPAGGYGCGAHGRRKQTQGGDFEDYLFHLDFMVVGFIERRAK
jgi:hypothetical protein